jgi:hypothetical protein
LNKSSLRADAKKTRRYIGHISYVRLLGLVVYRLNKKWSMGFWSAQRPLKVTYKMLKTDPAPDAKVEIGATSYPRRESRTGAIRVSPGWQKQIKARRRGSVGRHVQHARVNSVGLGCGRTIQINADVG